MTTVFDRLLSPVLRWLYQEPGVVAGSAGAPTQAASLYDATNALSAMAAFPWVMACLDVISTDLSGVPLVAVRRRPNGEREIMTDHSVLDLFHRPSPQSSGVAMRRQLYADFAAVREAYIRVMGPPGAGGVAVRIHPGEITPEIDPGTGLILHYRWGDKKIPPAEILMIRGIGWRGGIRASRAESPIHALEEGLRASQEARRMARKSASRGQVQMMLRPTDPVAQFGQSGVDAVTDAYLKATQSGHGLFVLNRALEATPLQLSPREMEFSKLEESVRYEVLAVLGVPPVLVGLPGANYGTARAESRAYWERRKHDARLFDDEFSRLTGDPNVRIEHDFRDVEALQTSRTERQQRAAVWVSLGMDPRAAAAYEGFDDAPIKPGLTWQEVRPPAGAPSAAKAEEPRERGAALRAWHAWALPLVDQHLGAAWLRGALAVDLETRLVAAGIDRDEAARVGQLGATILLDAVTEAIGDGVDHTQTRAWSPDLPLALEAM